jgi:hypothetical protein
LSWTTPVKRLRRVVTAPSTAIAGSWTTSLPKNARANRSRTGRSRDSSALKSPIGWRPIRLGRGGADVVNASKLCPRSRTMFSQSVRAGGGSGSKSAPGVKAHASSGGTSSSEPIARALTSGPGATNAMDSGSLPTRAGVKLGASAPLDPVSGIDQDRSTARRHMRTADLRRSGALLGCPR